MLVFLDSSYCPAGLYLGERNIFRFLGKSILILPRKICQTCSPVLRFDLCILMFVLKFQTKCQQILPVLTHHSLLSNTTNLSYCLLMGQMGEGSIIFVTFLHQRFLRYEQITPKVLRFVSKNGLP